MEEELNARQIATKLIAYAGKEFKDEDSFNKAVKRLADLIRLYAEKKCKQQITICSYKIKDDPDMPEGYNPSEFILQTPLVYLD